MTPINGKCEEAMQRLLFFYSESYGNILKLCVRVLTSIIIWYIGPQVSASNFSQRSLTYTIQTPHQPHFLHVSSTMTWMSIPSPEILSCLHLPLIVSDYIMSSKLSFDFKDSSSIHEKWDNKLSPPTLLSFFVTFGPYSFIWFFGRCWLMKPQSVSLQICIM